MHCARSFSDRGVRTQTRPPILVRPFSSGLRFALNITFLVVVTLCLFSHRQKSLRGEVHPVNHWWLIWPKQAAPALKRIGSELAPKSIHEKNMAFEQLSFIALAMLLSSADIDPAGRNRSAEIMSKLDLDLLSRSLLADRMDDLLPIYMYAWSDDEFLKIAPRSPKQAPCNLLRLGVSAIHAGKTVVLFQSKK